MSLLLFADVNKDLENLPRRERVKLRQREEILQAALKLFSGKGYHKVSMHEIAQEAEFGMGTVYKFFSNKEALYKALVTEMSERWHVAIMRGLEQERNPLRAIKKHIAIRQELFLQNLPVVRLYFSATQGAHINVRAGLDEDLLRLYDEFLEKLASVFERGMKETIFRVLDPYHMALALDAIINAFLFRMLEDPDRFCYEDNLSTATDIFLRGVLSK